MAEDSIENSLKAIDDLAIGHPQAKFVQDQLDGLYARGVRKKQAQCMTLTGPTGAGKTWALQRFMDRSNAEALEGQRADVEELPVVYVQAPNSASEKALAANILSELGDPAAERGTSDSLANRLRQRVDALGTRMIIIDEAQHLVDRRLTKTEKIRQTAEWMKNLLFDSQCVYVYAGLATTDELVKTNEQLARRCRKSINLAGFPFTTKDERKFFIKVVDKFVEASGFDLDVGDAKIYQAIHLATDGLLGSLAQLFQQAVEHAYEQNCDVINGDCLASAWKFTPLREVTENTKKLTHNPFQEFCSSGRR